MAQTIRLHRAGKIVVKPGAMTPGWIRELANRWVRLVVLRIFDTTSALIYISDVKDS